MLPHPHEVDLLKEHVAHQRQYDYYIIGLFGVAIAFLVQQTSQEHISFRHLPAGIAMLAWMVGLVLALLRQREIDFMMDANLRYLRLHRDDASKEDIADRKNVGSEVERHRANATRYSYMMHWMLVIGIVGFVTWHVVRMSRAAH